MKGPTHRPLSYRKDSEVRRTDNPAYMSETRHEMRLDSRHRQPETPPSLHLPVLLDLRGATGYENASQTRTSKSAGIDANDITTTPTSYK